VNSKNIIHLIGDAVFFRFVPRDCAINVLSMSGVGAKCINEKRLPRQPFLLSRDQEGGRGMCALITKLVPIVWIKPSAFVMAVTKTKKP